MEAVNNICYVVRKYCTYLSGIHAHGTMLLVARVRSSVPSTSTEDTKMLTAGLWTTQGNSWTSTIWLMCIS
jgi:hypothetical protein